MNYFVIQVKSKQEDKFLELSKGKIKEEVGRLLWPRKRLTIRRKGKKLDSLHPIFPGYIFLETHEVTKELYSTIRCIPGYMRFLLNSQDIKPLNSSDKNLLLHFLSFGEIVDKSKVYFDENSKIVVKSGPLKGLEGQIVRVDKRKGRAKIRLNMYENSFLVDFGFQTLALKDGTK